MPQMAPLNWLTLFFYFIIIFFLFNILNYFTLKPQNNKLINKKLKIKINWKW